MRYTVLLVFSLITVLVVHTAAKNTGTFTDERDDQEYKWVRIGDQIWMAENLNYNSGRGSGQYDRIYGRLYNWKTAKNVCPKGWHLPSDAEWKELESYAGMRDDELDNESTRESGNVGLKLKSKRGWKLYFGKSNGIDSYGFKALPGGYYQHYREKFMHYGTRIVFWTSTPSDSENAYARDLDSMSDGIGRSEMYKVHGCYCRCVRD